MTINMKKTYIYIILLITAVALWRCTKPYQPAEITTDYGYLVVEGNINPGTDSTIIKLSRTTKLSSKTSTRVELKAIVTVEDEQNASKTISETGNGNYAAVGLNLDNTKKYRLRVKTTNGKIYLSDFVPVKNAPPIDSVGYTVTNDGINIYNNAHDATNNTRYYRYEYQETWQFQSAFNSKYVAVLGQLGLVGLSLRTPDQQVFTCWANDASSTIILGSTIRLSQDVLSQNPITQIASNSEKIGIKYSILLKQYALTEDAYNFWTLMKTNTEQLGSIFDAQPTLLKGNIHNVADATEPVIGYISVGAIQSKRIFISKANLSVNWHVFDPQTCVLDTAYIVDPISGANDVKLTLINNPPSAIAIDNLGALGFSRSSKVCADCTLRGVNKQPSFWK